MNLDKCLNHLENPSMDDDPPRKCYQLLDFPKTKKEVRLDPGPHYLFFKKYKNVKIFSNGILEMDLQKFKIYVPPKFKRTLKSFSQRYIIIPIHFKKLKTCYALLYDKNQAELQMFIPPGNHQKILSPKNNRDFELKIRSLFSKRLQIPMAFYYHLIAYKPDRNTIHEDFWPSWLISLRIKKTIDRETLVNIALKQILTKNKNYHKFISDFTKFIKSK